MANSRTITVVYLDGKFLARGPHENLCFGVSLLGPREAALAMAEHTWGPGAHHAICTEVHGAEASGTFIITRAELQEVQHADA